MQKTCSKNLVVKVAFISMFLVAHVAIAQTAVSLDEAFAVAKRAFLGMQNVDYYLCEDSTQRWTFFADPEPLKGWEHDCYLIYVPKVLNQGDLLGSSTAARRMPPDGTLTPMLVSDYYESQGQIKPYVASANLSTEDLTVARRTYAVILSGGVNKNNNHERYWNDCSFIYQTLVKKYGLPRNNVNVIMSDGTSPVADMRSLAGGYKSSPLDLDADGNNDIGYSATRANIRLVLNTLSQKVNKNDHLFFFVIDHGGTTDNISSSYINLWGNAILYDYELADWLQPFIEKSVNVNVVLGQCYSGGFIDDLTEVGCVVSTASSGSEYSWACSDRPYDEFVYQWTTAINGANSYGTAVYSDVDNNGKITMQEAFTYAKNNDRANETPQYVSTPISIGEDLAFNHVPSSVDLYIKDNPEDTGKEPNLTTDKFWKSPDIWVRNSADGVEVHENPYFTIDHTGATIYARIHNRGKENYESGRWLHIYWAKASTNFSMNTWKGRELYNDEYATGGVLEPVKIPPIEAGDSCIVSINWGLPKMLEAEDAEKHHFCLLANIRDISYPDYTIDESNPYFNVKGENGIAQKNVTIIKRTDATKDANVYVRNANSGIYNYSLELVPQAETDVELFDLATVNITLSTPIYNAWVRGGSVSEDVRQNTVSMPNKLELLSPQSRIKNLKLNSNEFETVTMSFEFHTGVLGLKSYTFDLIQRDESGNIVGGETFVVEVPLKKVDFPIVINSIDLENGDVELQTNLEETVQTIKWFDAEGAEIGKTSSVVVTPTSQSNDYSVTVYTNSGEIATESITLNPTGGIKSVSPTSSVSDYINVEFYRENTSSNSCILVSSATQNISLLNIPVAVGLCNITINTSTLAPGLYVLSYIVDGLLVDSKKFSK